MSDTPRTDSAVEEVYELGIGLSYKVDADVSRLLERDLNSARDRIRELESKVTAHEKHAALLKVMVNATENH